MKTSMLSAWIVTLWLLWSHVGAQEVTSPKIEETTMNTGKSIEAALINNWLTPEVKTLIQKKVDELVSELRKEGLQVSGTNIHIAPSTDSLIFVTTGTDDARTWRGGFVKKD